MMMHGNTMFAPLAPDEMKSTSPLKAAINKTPIIPVPADAPPMHFKHPKHGEPSNSWPYRDADGRVVGYVCRWDFLDAEGKSAKEILPVTYCDLGNGKRGWRSKGIPSPRPLYGLPDIIARSDAPLLVVEGEKTRDAAAVLFPNMVATTPPHGAKSPHKVDWAPVAGRNVVIWPDHDDPGAKYVAAVVELVHDAGAAAVAIVDVPGDWPNGWDLADDLPDGVTATDLQAMIDSAKPPIVSNADEPARDWPFRLAENGVEKRVERVDHETGNTTAEWKWFASHLEVVAETRSSEGEEWGRLLQIADRDGRVKSWAMPMSMLAGDGTAYRERLLLLGLVMAPGRFARDALHEYISTARPDVKARCAARIGWHLRTFVGVDENFGGPQHG